MLRFLPAVVAIFATQVPVGAQEASNGAGSIELLADVDTVVDVEPEAGVMTVSNHYRFENPTVDDGFTGFFEILPWDATDVVAEAGGVMLSAVGLPARDGFAEWLISFPEPLAPGGALAVTLSWRSEGLDSDPDTFGLVSRDLVSIAPYAAQHQGRSTLTVNVEGAFEVVLAKGYEWGEDDGALSFSVGETTGYSTVPLVLEAPDRFVRNRIDNGGLQITIATANGPAPWLATDLDQLVRVLAEWIPLAPPGPLEFRQGYTGAEPQRMTADGAVVLPVSVDPVVALRTVADHWLSALEFDDPTLGSALAAAIADGAAASTGRTPVPRSGPWVTSMDALVSVSDASTVRTVLAALDAGVPAYPGVDDEFVADPVGWRRLTDVFEHVGGVPATAAAMRLSVSDAERVELDRRSSALADFRALEERAAPWAMPPLLREPMAAWQFDTLADRQGPVSDLVGARDEMVAAASAVGVEIGGFVQAEFETATTSMDRAWVRHAEQRETLDVVAEALRLEADDRGLLSVIGMWGNDPDVAKVAVLEAWDRGDFDQAAADAHELIDDLESSVGRGTLRVVVPVALVVGVAIALQTGWSRRPRRVHSVE